MTKENKELLLKDLCGRLPYGVKFRYKYIDEFFHEEYGTSTLDGVIPPYRIIHSTLVGEDYLKIEEDEVKPYLFPLSSMTEKQKEELKSLGWNFDNFEIHNVSECLGTYREYVAHSDCFVLIDWLNKNHFDYMGLISKELAIDATSLNIY